MESLKQIKKHILLNTFDEHKYCKDVPNPCYVMFLSSKKLSKDDVYYTYLYLKLALKELDILPYEEVNKKYLTNFIKDLKNVDGFINLLNKALSFVYHNKFNYLQELKAFNDKKLQKLHARICKDL